MNEIVVTHEHRGYAIWHFTDEESKLVEYIPYATQSRATEQGRKLMLQLHNERRGNET